MYFEIIFSLVYRRLQLYRQYQQYVSAAREFVCQNIYALN